MIESFENRDLQCANEVAEMARLGKFDTEFLIFGSAIQEADGKIYYYATSNHSKLLEYIQQARYEARYFMPIVRYMRRVQVPADLRDEWMVRTKLALIREMKRQYEEYLPMMQPFFQTMPSDDASTLLEAYRDRIDGYFDDTKLQLFWGLVKMGYDMKLLTRDSYCRFQTWHEKVRRQMSDDPIESDNITRVFYGFVCVDKDNRRQCVFDAQIVDVAQKWREKLMQGCLVAPIIKKQFAFKQFSEMPEVRRRYSAWLSSAESDAYLALVKSMRAMPSVIDERALQSVENAVQNRAYAAYATAYFQALWNVHGVSEKAMQKWRNW